MSKLSVIIPTLQMKRKVLIKSVSQLLRDDVVDEIIVINNLVDTPLQDEVFSHKKVKIYTPKENLFVNPSWNLGVEMARNNKFLLLNDDILFEENYCTRVLEHEVWNEQYLGLIGMYSQYIDERDKNSSDDLDYPPMNNEPLSMLETFDFKLPGHWGVAIFGDKKNYYEIPDDFKIIYGDNYLIYANIKDGKTCYCFKGIRAVHLYSSSSSSNDSSITQPACCDYLNAKNKYPFLFPFHVEKRV